MTQLTMEQIEPTTTTHECPVRSRCMMTMAIKAGGAQQIVERPRSEVGTSCGFEQADTIAACPKKRGLEGR